MQVGGRGAADRLADLHFTMQHAETAELSRVEVTELDASLRSLLFTDGTVSRTLEAQALQRVAVEVVEQTRMPLCAPAAHYLQASAGGQCVRRRVILSAGGCTPAVWAESHILPERLPAQFLGLLDVTPSGIGGSIEHSRLESRRELLWFRMGAPPAWQPSDSIESALVRLYRIVTNQRPALLIRESFAVHLQSGVYRPVGWTDAPVLAVGGPARSLSE